ncbi:MAG: NAD-dependent epimerase/dehydratase family protein, partial [Bacteroidetes bacterium]|nr:NAD-dependent epimerase/dehydratase family protein [Bacteroidota bacterium]
QPQPELCHFSSTATMGKADGLIDESTTFVSDEDTSFYAQSKYLAELEAIRGREEGLRVAIINPCIILGFGNMERGPSRFFRNARKSFPFYPPGSNAFVDVRDVVNYAVGLMENGVFNDRFLCIGFNASYKEVFTRMAVEFGTKPPRIRVQPWMVEVAWRLTSVTRYLGVPSLISRSSARAGMKQRSFTSAALISRLGDRFTDPSTCIRDHVARYQSK